MEWTLERTRQPSSGGEIIFVFAFGSQKFDDYFGSTQFRGFICDDCAEKYVDKMEKSGTGSPAPK